MTINWAFTVGWTALLVMNLLDYFMTNRALAMGVEELNPIADFLIEEGMLLTVKLVLMWIMLPVVFMTRVRPFIAIIFWVAVIHYAVVTALHLTAGV